MLVEMTRGRQDESRMNWGISPGISRVYFFMIGKRDGLLTMKSEHSARFQNVLQMRKTQQHVHQETLDLSAAACRDPFMVWWSKCKKFCFAGD